ncbi:Uncharacterized protein Fot_06069 [Forsythia ovata]|uniref:Uncharacterized protein n=1 Tax=Forsythia ovata TaxID=205694 RepID=A0ABD1WRW9_9LAMI
MDKTMVSMHPNTYICKLSLRPWAYEFKNGAWRNNCSESMGLEVNEVVPSENASRGEGSSSFVTPTNWDAFIADYGAFKTNVLEHLSDLREQNKRLLAGQARLSEQIEELDSGLEEEEN